MNLVERRRQNRNKTIRILTAIPTLFVIALLTYLNVVPLSNTIGTIALVFALILLVTYIVSVKKDKETEDEQQ